MDVGGVDLFTVTKSDLGKTRIPGTLEFARSVHPVFDIGLKTFVNQQSYGMAYLVNHTTYADPDSIQFYENIIKQHFLKHRDPTKFVAATTVLYQQLMGLKNQHDIILEAKKADQRIENNPAGSVAIKGIVGKRALFHTNCLRDHCTFVFNIAKTQGWHAYVNGKPSEITRANFAFIATTVPHGASTVWFIYESPAQTIPYFFSIISLMVLIILMCSKYMSDPFKYFQANVNTKDSNDAS